MRKCPISFLGLEVEGVFRVNGNARVVDNFRNSFDSNNPSDVTLDAKSDVVSVASLLKLFLRELPEGVVPESETREFVRSKHRELNPPF